MSPILSYFIKYFIQYLLHGDPYLFIECPPCKKELLESVSIRFSHIYSSIRIREKVLVLIFADVFCHKSSDLINKRDLINYQDVIENVIFSLLVYLYVRKVSESIETNIFLQYFFLRNSILKPRQSIDSKTRQYSFFVKVSDTLSYTLSKTFYKERNF